MNQNKLPDFGLNPTGTMLTGSGFGTAYRNDLNKTINKLLIGESEMTSFDLKTIDRYNKNRKGAYRDELLSQMSENRKRKESQKLQRQKESYEFEKKVERERELLRNRYLKEEVEDVAKLTEVAKMSEVVKVVTEEKDILDTIEPHSVGVMTKKSTLEEPVKLTPLKIDQSIGTDPGYHSSIFAKSAKDYLKYGSPAPDTLFSGRDRNTFFARPRLSSFETRSKQRHDDPPTYKPNINTEMIKTVKFQDLFDEIQTQSATRKQYRLITFDS
jgi:hypothetical protein